MGVDDDEDELLQALGRIAREDPARDPRWDAYAAGELSDDEVAQLQAQAQDSEEGRALLAAFTPLDQHVLGQVAAQAREALAERRDEHAVPAALPPSRKGRVWGPPLALAATVLLTIGVLFNQQQAVTPTGLPDYSVQLSGQVQAVRGSRGDGDGVATFTTGNKLRIVLTPSTSVGGPVAPVLALRHAGEVIALSAPSVRTSASGAVLMEGIVGEGFSLPIGTSQLLVAIGDPKQLPDIETLAANLGERSSTTQTGWMAWALALQVE